jgi:hypothetical protein
VLGSRDGMQHGGYEADMPAMEQMQGKVAPE